LLDSRPRQRRLERQAQPAPWSSLSDSEGCSKASGLRASWAISSVLTRKDKSGEQKMGLPKPYTEETWSVPYFLVELILPFQQVRNQDDEPALQFPEVALAHVLKLLDQMCGIDVPLATGAQQIDLLSNPGIEVAFVKIGVVAHGADVRDGQ
jgi:hypothetical protein